MFTAAVRDQWNLSAARSTALAPDELSAIVEDELPANRSVMILDLDGGGGTVTATPTRAQILDVVDGSTVSRPAVWSAIAGAGWSMTDPDYLFYLPTDQQSRLMEQPVTAHTRQLVTADAEPFAQFTAAAPPDDRDEAFVELDHWLVYGTFVEDRLACAASMYPWSGTRLADLGVLTLPEFRHRGLGVRTVGAISAAALRRGHEPQYRCQLDNEASVRLAHAAGFVGLGTWHVSADDG